MNIFLYDESFNCYEKKDEYQCVKALPELNIFYSEKSNKEYTKTTIY